MNYWIYILIFSNYPLPGVINSYGEIDNHGANAKYVIFFRCKSHLDDADLVIALLDGPQVDDGAACEIGYFYAKKSPEQKIIGIRTDFRRAGESEDAVVKDYTPYCTSLARSGTNPVNGCLSRSFLPWHLNGLSVPGGSKRYSFLSLQAKEELNLALENAQNWFV